LLQQNLRSLEEEISEKKPNRKRKNHKQGIQQLGSRDFIKFPSLADADAISLWGYEEADDMECDE
jgi:hypothetical protein